MGIRFESGDDLPLGKILSIPSMVIIVTAAFRKTMNIIHKFIYINVSMKLQANYKSMQFLCSVHNIISRIFNGTQKR